MTNSHESGSSQARRAARSTDSAQIAEDGQPLLNAEQAREIRMMESANERLRFERLRAQAWERWKEERKFGHSKP